MKIRTFIFYLILLSLFIGSSGNPISCIQQKMGCIDAIGWEELGEGSASGEGIYDNTLPGMPNLLINNSGNPIVVWPERGTFHIVEWDENYWVRISSLAINGTYLDHWQYKTAIDSINRITIVWQDNYGLYVKRWDGTSWEELGGSASGGGLAIGNYPCLGIDNSDNPIVSWCAWESSTGPIHIHLKRWNSISWEELDGSATDEGIFNGVGGYLSMAINDLGNPVVTTVYGIKRWNGSSWENIGTDFVKESDLSLAINNLGNPVVAWIIYAGDFKYNIYLKQWNGSNWEELGGSASGSGLIGDAGGYLSFSLTINNDGNPIVAWDDYSSWSNHQIYVTQWNGTNWEEVGYGSTTSSGISNTGRAGNPSIAINGTGNPVITWRERFDGNNCGIYVKQYISSE